MRQIILDTETTGLDPTTGDRLVEIACIETINTVPSGENFHVYIDPQRDVPEEAFRVHGLSADFLRGKHLFENVAEEFLAFIGDATLVIHNAEFDMRFINSELKRCGRAPIPMDRVIDTLAMARRKHPGSPNSLDALCTRYRIDNSRRVKHGALLDAELLAEVYSELSGGRQSALVLASEIKVVHHVEAKEVRPRPQPLSLSISSEEENAHRSFIGKMGEKALWQKYNLAKAS